MPIRSIWADHLVVVLRSLKWRWSEWVDMPKVERKADQKWEELFNKHKLANCNGHEKPYELRGSCKIL